MERGSMGSFNRGLSKTLPTDPRSIPQTPNQQFMKEFLSFGGERGCLGYAKQGYVGFPLESLNYMKLPILLGTKLHEDVLIWSNYSDLTRPHPKWWFSKGIPLISGKSR